MKRQRRTRPRGHGLAAMHTRRAQRAAGRLVMATAGYAAAYFLDPQQGPERRRRVRRAALDDAAARQRRQRVVPPPVHPVRRAAC